MENSALKQLGFREKEILVYLEVLKRGKVLPAEVAQLTGLNRSTVYSIASVLKKRGVLTEDLGGPVRYLVAQPPDALSQITAQEEREMFKKKALVQEAISELKTIARKPVYAPPKITFITQAEIRAYLEKRTPIWNESILKTDGIWWGYQDHAFVDAYGDWINWYWTKAAPANLHLILLSNASETEKQMTRKLFAHREIRFWKDAGEFTATLWINGDYVVMISTREEPHYLVEIYDRVLAKNLREMFKGISKGIKK